VLHVDACALPRLCQPGLWLLLLVVQVFRDSSLDVFTGEDMATAVLVAEQVRCRPHLHLLDIASIHVCCHMTLLQLTHSSRSSPARRLLWPSRTLGSCQGRSPCPTC
jgi:hypothetical protein